MKAFLLYFGFWLVGSFATIAFRSISLIKYGLLRDVTEVTSLIGAAHQVLIASAMSRVIANSIVMVILYAVTAYPIYFFIRKKVKYPSLLIFAVLGILTCFSYEHDIISVVIKIVAIAIFIWLGLSVPSKIIAKRMSNN